MRYSDRRTGRAAGAVLLSMSVVAGLWGCGRDARLAGQHIRDPRVGPVTAFGKILNQDASPQDVVITLLRAIQADYAAGDDLAARDKALEVQFDLSAPNYIKAHLLGAAGLSEQRRLELYNSLVRHWAPTLGYYRHLFSADETELAERMLTVERTPASEGGPARRDVYINLDPPPLDEGEVPSGPVVAHVELVNEGGYWRIGHVGWERSMRNWRDTPLARLGGRAKAKPKDEPAESPPPAGS